MLSVYVGFWVNTQTWWAIQSCTRILTKRYSTSFNFQSLDNSQGFESLIYDHGSPIKVVSCRPQPSSSSSSSSLPSSISYYVLTSLFPTAPANRLAAQPLPPTDLGIVPRLRPPRWGVKFRCFWSCVILRNQWKSYIVTVFKLSKLTWFL